VLGNAGADCYTNGALYAAKTRLLCPVVLGPVTTRNWINFGHLCNLQRISSKISLKLQPEARELWAPLIRQIR
jgi:hypothetical protein